MKIKSGAFDILESGSVIQYKNEPVEFIIQESGAPLIIRFCFKDEEDSKPIINPELLNPQELNIIFTNFNSSLGTCNTDPIEIGTLNNRKLYLNYYIYAIEKDHSKLVNYTWYLGEAQK